MSKFLEVVNLTKWFEENGEKVVVLDGISFDVEKGEFVAILGPSGCGKTTLLRIIAGLDNNYSGKVLLKGKQVVGPGRDRSMVFQNFALFPWRTVLGNITFGLEVMGVPKEERIRRAKEFIKLVNLDGFENYYPHQISGGMKQRVALVRSLICDPEILLMDEPLSALDAQTRNFLQEELVRVWEETRKTIVYVTHNIEEAIYLADRVVVMTHRPAKIRAIFDVDLPRPRNRFSQKFVEFRAKIYELLRGFETKTLTS